MYAYKQTIILYLQNLGEGGGGMFCMHASERLFCATPPQTSSIIAKNERCSQNGILF